MAHIKLKGKIKKSGAPPKGYKWKESTSGRIPDPEIEPVSSPKKVKLKPMRTIASGSGPSGSPRTKVKLRSKAKY